jgi:hypothetical protein
MPPGHGVTIDFGLVCGRRFGFHGVDGKLRTDNFAVMAVDAIIRFHRFRRVVAFLVESAGKGKYAPGAEFDAVAAPLAAVVDDTNRSLCNLNHFGVERNTPEFHVCFLFYCIQIPVSGDFDHAAEKDLPSGFLNQGAIHKEKTYTIGDSNSSGLYVVGDLILRYPLKFCQGISKIFAWADVHAFIV